MTTPFKSVKMCALLLSVGLLGACSMNSPTWVNQNRVEVHEDQFTDTFETEKMNKGLIRAVANYHYRFGNGPLNLVVGYDPKSKTNTMSKANSEAVRISDELRRNGVKDISVQTIALAGTQDRSLTTVTFPAVVAKAPAKCGMIPGYNTATTVPETGQGPAPYELGCTIETLMAQQISRPADLLGRKGFETNADGRRQEAVVGSRGYYGDKSYESLDGEQSSED